MKWFLVRSRFLLSVCGVRMEINIYSNWDVIVRLGRGKGVGFFSGVCYEYRGLFLEVLVVILVLRFNFFICVMDGYSSWYIRF